jgi:hypothetical protein
VLGGEVVAERAPVVELEVAQRADTARERGRGRLLVDPGRVVVDHRRRSCGICGRDDAGIISTSDRHRHQAA